MYLKTKKKDCSPVTDQSEVLIIFFKINRQLAVYLFFCLILKNIAQEICNYIDLNKNYDKIYLNKNGKYINFILLSVETMERNIE